MCQRQFDAMFALNGVATPEEPSVVAFSTNLKFLLEIRDLKFLRTNIQAQYWNFL